MAALTMQNFYVRLTGQAVHAAQNTYAAGHQTGTYGTKQDIDQYMSDG